MIGKPTNSNSVFLRAFHYIKDNFIIGYSLVLLLLVPAVFFANNFWVNNKYAEVIDGVTRKKAILVEDVLNNIVYEKFSNTAELQSLVKGIVAEDEEIISLSILEPIEGQEAWNIVVSSDESLVGKTKEENDLIYFARVNPEGATYLDENRSGRFWKIIKTVSGGEPKKNVGLMEMSLSLGESDTAINETIDKSYWVMALIILVLVLLQANQIRLLEYALSLNELKQVDKMKDMFISMASHELRSPLTAIKGFLDLLKEKKNLNLDSESAHYLEVISISSDRLGHLVDDILDVSRLEGNRFPMEVSVFDPDPLIKQSVEESRSTAIQKGLALEYLAPAAPVMIKADVSRFKQVVVNLIGNALKYTDKGSVKVSTAVKKDDFMVIVADTGIGISSEEQANLFQKFYRVKNDRTRDIIGTGLGLWITMETVKRMKGKITVESIEGVGSHFTVHLPLGKK